MLLIEDGKAQIVERRKIDCREWLTVLTVNVAPVNRRAPRVHSGVFFQEYQSRRTPMQFMSVEPLSRQEEAMLEKVFPSATFGEIDQKSAVHMPRLMFGFGADLWFALSQIILTFGVPAGTILVTKALEAIGSEVGRKMVRTFKEKIKNPDGSRKRGAPLFPVVFVYQPKAKVIVHIVFSEPVPVSPVEVVAKVDDWIKSHLRPRESVMLYVIHEPAGWVVSEDYDMTARQALDEELSLRETNFKKAKTAQDGG